MFPPVDIDPFEFDIEEPTRPMGKCLDDQLKERWKADGLCPECGDKGDWVACALVCPTHGKFMG